ncbi:hypothetical protein HFN89_05025 [Rhizobium laguerreae]|nr:hypothetical protein [Rhizobium laguerreae]
MPIALSRRNDWNLIETLMRFSHYLWVYGAGRGEIVSGASQLLDGLRFRMKHDDPWFAGQVGEGCAQVYLNSKRLPHLASIVDRDSREAYLDELQWRVWKETEAEKLAVVLADWRDRHAKKVKNERLFHLIAGAMGYETDIPIHDVERRPSVAEADAKTRLLAANAVAALVGTLKDLETGLRDFAVASGGDIYICNEHIFRNDENVRFARYFGRSLLVATRDKDTGRLNREWDKRHRLPKTMSDAISQSFNNLGLKSYPEYQTDNRSLIGPSFSPEIRVPADGSPLSLTLGYPDQGIEWPELCYFHGSLDELASDNFVDMIAKYYALRPWYEFRNDVILERPVYYQKIPLVASYELSASGTVQRYDPVFDNFSIACRKCRNCRVMVGRFWR